MQDGNKLKIKMENIEKENQKIIKELEMSEIDKKRTVVKGGKTYMNEQVHPHKVTEIERKSKWTCEGSKMPGNCYADIDPT